MTATPATTSKGHEVFPPVCAEDPCGVLVGDVVAVTGRDRLAWVGTVVYINRKGFVWLRLHRPQSGEVKFHTEDVQESADSGLFINERYLER